RRELLRLDEFPRQLTTRPPPRNKRSAATSGQVRTSPLFVDAPCSSKAMDIDDFPAASLVSRDGAGRAIGESTLADASSRGAYSTASLGPRNLSRSFEVKGVSEWLASVGPAIARATAGPRPVPLGRQSDVRMGMLPRTDCRQGRVGRRI